MTSSSQSYTVYTNIIFSLFETVYMWAKQAKKHNENDVTEIWLMQPDTIHKCFTFSIFCYVDSIIPKCNPRISIRKTP